MDELERLKLALSKSQSVVYEWNNSGTISWFGDVCAVLSLNSMETTLAKIDICSKKGFTSLIHKDDIEKYTTSLESALLSGGDFCRNYRIQLNENKVISIRDNGTVLTSGKEKILLGTLTTFPKVTGLHVAAKDNLLKNTSGSQSIAFSQRSDLLNTAFQDSLNRAIVESLSNQTSGVLLNVSIDTLLTIMTWYSSDFAERIMSALEIQLKTLFRKDVVINRLAVDKFGIILQNHSHGEAELVIDRILRYIQLYQNPSFKEPLHLRTSIGSVSFPQHASTAEEALNKAYLALKGAENSASEFHCDYQDAHREQVSWNNQVTKLNYLRNTIKENKLCLAFQPLVSSKTGEVSSYECLLRIAEDDGSILSAGPLIPIAEKMGLIDIVDQYVLEKVVDELKNNNDVTLGFNVSSMTTSNPKWLKMCTKLLNDPELASRVIVEITETATQKDMRQTAYFVAALQALGCKVALDDFGAGYTSFRQLKSLSVDMVKIDGIYVLGLEENSENLLFIKTLLKFNHAYGVETIAECVENGEVAKILMENDIDYLQGFYFGKPDIKRPWAGEREPYEKANN